MVFALNLFNKEEFSEIKKYTTCRSKNPDKMKNIKFSKGHETGCPILPESSAFLECRVQTILDNGGDHDIIIGEIVAGGNNKPGGMADTLTLTDLGWNYAG